jgi:hypothetical protein
MNNNILINGRSYDWANIELTLLGKRIFGITSIEYSDSVEKENIMGAGQYAVSRGVGHYKAEAKITLLAEEVNLLQKALPAGKHLTDIPMFDVIVSYLPKDATKRTVDIIRNCEFKNNKRAVKTNDKSIEVELELITSHIEWGR